MNRIKLISILLLCHAWLGCTVRAAWLDSSGLQHVAFPDARFTVNGLPWFEEDKPALRRLPLRLKNSFRPAVWSLAQNTSGGRIRFKTDSQWVGIIAENPDTNGMHHMTTIGQSGFDIYVENEYRSSAWPDKTGKIVKDWHIGKAGQMREITLYLPLYNGVTIKEIVLEPNARIEKPSSFALARPVVFYGSSITQGGCASNSGMSYEAQVARWLNLDFVNLGFSGNGLGEPALAEAISEIDAACFVLDYWGNPTPEVFKNTLPHFVETLRNKFPKTPILVTSPYYISGETPNQKEGTLNEKTKIAKEFVSSRQKAGDRFITFVDGLEMLSRDQAGGLVDGAHANSLGFYFCAKGLEPYLRKAVKLPHSPHKK